MKVSKRRCFPSHVVYDEPIPRGSSKDILDEFIRAVELVSERDLLVKWSSETTKNRWVFSPKEINSRIRDILVELGWSKEITSDEHPEKADFGKQRIIAEVQMGKYSFVSTDIADMRYMHKRNQMDLGILLVPDGHLFRNMSTGPASFKYAIHRAEKEEVSFPLVILGMDVERMPIRKNSIPMSVARKIRPEGPRRIYGP